MNNFKKWRQKRKKECGREDLMEISLKKYVLIILQKYTKRKYKIQTPKEGDEFY